MALFLLASTTSWKVEKHYCMGRLMDVSLFVDVEDCGMDMTFMSDSRETVEKKSCCDDKVIVWEGQDDATTSPGYMVDLGQGYFLMACASSWFAPLEPLSLHPVPHERYIPPKIVKDIHLLDDVFLI
ncbi:hypothetical protein SAMN04488513_101997 [Pseudozobellia thermophila]|uniref:Uncharacterized protein n=2 Tax=Pseudozobellia thermophila TaxID=192903 RepID=A0A1M6D6G0_9FLAO|nr:hypothetical protein SAMN04488513_101997 [Pseudozobellia thermophila]